MKLSVTPCAVRSAWMVAPSDGATDQLAYLALDSLERVDVYRAALKAATETLHRQHCEISRLRRMVAWGRAQSHQARVGRG